MIISPEIIIFNTLKSVLKHIRLDYDAKVNKSESLLGLMLEGLSIQRYDFLTQAESVFITLEDNPRHLDVNMFFNASRASIPTIHITLPSEDSAENGLGIDEGYTDDIEFTDDYYTTFTRRFSTSYNLIITSDNTNEVVLIYHALKAFCQSLIPHFNAAGLENIKIAGRDIQLNTSLIPTNVFSRAVSLSFSYENTTPNLFLTENMSIDDVVFNPSDIITVQNSQIVNP